MRAKQRATATGMYSRSGTFANLTPLQAEIPIPIPMLVPRVGRQRRYAASVPCPERIEDDLPKGSCAEGLGLLHDTRNLMNALGLYCDLLMRPGVLQPAHQHYAEELRLIWARSGAMMERLLVPEAKTFGAGAAGRIAGVCYPTEVPAEIQTEIQTRIRTLADERDLEFAVEPEGLPSVRTRPVSLRKPVALRSIVERCSGLLRQVAGGRAIEVTYGPAASVPVLVDEEAIERILLNLVRNAAAALEGCETACLPAGSLIERRAVTEGRGKIAGDVSSRDFSYEDETREAVRIGVGLLANRVGAPRPFPFERVRLTVEDSGCGMAPRELERVMSGGVAPLRGHGIGLRVVRELVGASRGELRATSAVGVGTRVQIEWPMAMLRSTLQSTLRSGMQSGMPLTPPLASMVPTIPMVSTIPIVSMVSKVVVRRSWPDAAGVVDAIAGVRDKRSAATSTGRTMPC